MKKYLLTLFWALPISLLAQDCDCTSSFNWMYEVFAKNDAGYEYALAEKGAQAFELHHQAILAKVKTAENDEACAQLMRSWLDFFRSGHLGLEYLNAQPNSTTSEPTEEEIRAQFADWEKMPFDLKEFKKYLKNKKEVDYEGIWQSGVYQIGIRKVGTDYIGFIIEADGVYWMPGQVKLRIPTQSGEPAVYYMRDHSAEQFEEAQLIEKNYLTMGFIDLERTYPKYPDAPELQRYLRAMTAEKPYFEQLNDQTTYIRIPTFDRTQKKWIDQVLEENKAAITSSDQMIIDIRGNGGGSDASYYELLPFLYTNPIRTVGVEFLSTPLNNQRMLDFINDPAYEFTDEEKEWAQTAYDQLDAQKGKFVNLDSTIVDIYRLEEVLPQPGKVAILIDQQNGSTSEQFLLAAKQSQKVKLYGVTTYGVLDVSNMYAVKSPCEKYRLHYSLSRSMRIPDMTIDEKGIQPDYYLDRSIPKHHWIQFVLDAWSL